MQLALAGLWERASSSYWLPPSLLAATGFGLAVVMLALDSAGADGAVGEYLPWLYTGGAEGAREILGSVAASMMTVLSVTFSITIVALTVASQQFGPRVLHNFIRQPGPQVVLGGFIATFIYSLLVLRTVRSEGQPFVPHLSVTVAVMLAILSIGALIYFIYHVSSSIQASTIISEIGSELDGAIGRLFPERLARGEPDGAREAGGASAAFDLPDGFLREARPVEAHSSGYIQAVDAGGIARLAADHDILIRLDHRPGDFVVKGATVATVGPAGRLDDGARKRLQKMVLIGPRRTPAQDAGFGLTQLLEIALHALSPSMNEPFLAINCIDRLIQALCHLAERAIPSPRRYDDEGKLRVITSPLTFVEAADNVFEALLQPASSNVTAASRLLEGIGVVAPYLRREEDRDTLFGWARVLHRETREAVPADQLRKRLDDHYATTVAALQAATVATRHLA